MLSTPNVIFLWIVILCFNVTPLYADDIIVQGDTWILSDTDSTYSVTIVNNYPFMTKFNYIFDIDLPVPVHDEIFSDQSASWKHSFSKVPIGTYTMKIQVYIYWNGWKGWRVGYKTLTLQIRDSLDDFISVIGQQNDLPSYTPDSIYLFNKTVNITANLQENSILNIPSTSLDYSWTVNGPDMNNTKYNLSSFQHVYNSTGDYIIDLTVTAHISPNISKSGQVKFKISIKKPLSDVSIKGFTNIQKGTFLDLNLTCTGSSKFVVCYEFSNEKSNQSCSNQSRIVDNCNYNIKHYFYVSGDKYLNIRIHNDVSEISKTIKIMVYRYHPKPPIIFVIIPLVSFIMVIVIVVIGITYHIKQRRLLNATIEVATAESFGLREDEEYKEKTLFQRIRDSFYPLFNSQ